MVWQRVRMSLLAGLAIAVLALPTQADDQKKDAPPAITGGAAPAPAPAQIAPAPMPAPAQAMQPIPAAAPAPVSGDCGTPCGPTFKTICVTEYTQETVPCTRTVYKTEYKQETYTAYRCESVPETRTRTFTVSRMVPETQVVTKNVCVTVPVTETKTVMESFTTCRPVTTMVTKCVDRGHWDCKEVPCDECGSGHGGKLKGLFHGCKKHSDCCETACANPCGDACGGCAVPMKTVKVWVPCMVTEQVPCTKMERICEQRPVTKCCTTYKTETRQVTCNVTVCRCVSEQKTETYTCNVSKTVPYQATRCVAVCVPCTETYNVTRCVPHTVTKQVAVDCGGCGDSCGGGCGACAATTCCSPKHKLFGGHAHEGHGHKSSCGCN